MLAFSSFRVWIWMQQVEGLAYYNLYLFTRIDGICIGCMVALMQKINPRFIGKYTAPIVLVFAAINFIFYFINQRHANSFPYLGLVGFSTFSMIFGLLVYDMVNHGNSFFSRMFDFEFLKFIGRISYGTYIFHWPLYLLLNPMLSRLLTPVLTGLPNLFLSSSIITVLAYTVGYFSFRYFETPFLNLKKYFKA
ncbi:MAG TPA: acyltransferase family protein, partial [Chitinophagaceae bacterium]|jgi:peptidoglycan/LPS O-acetylase OafA/YrhL|nr:acyltransferase family protein [Chitinophagaceae bacterium]